MMAAANGGDRISLEFFFFSPSLPHVYSDVGYLDRCYYTCIMNSINFSSFFHLLWSFVMIIYPYTTLDSSCSCAHP